MRALWTQSQLLEHNECNAINAQVVKQLYTAMISLLCHVIKTVSKPLTLTAEHLVVTAVLSSISAGLKIKNKRKRG